MYVLCAAEWSFRAIAYRFVHRHTSRFGSKRDFKNMVELFDCKMQEKAPKSNDFGAFYGKQHPFRYRHLCILSEGVTIHGQILLFPVRG